jgi:hypothetical protein
MDVLEDVDIEGSPIILREELVPTKTTKRKKKLTAEEVAVLLPDISIKSYNEPSQVKTTMDSLLSREIGEPRVCFEARSKLAHLILDSDMGLNAAASISVSRMILLKVRLGVKYETSIEEVLDRVLRHL